MNNDPELSGKYLGTISADFVNAADTLKEASYQIRKAGFAYPIFAISKEVVPIGQLLIDKISLQLDWNYFASFMDEFVQLPKWTLEKIEMFPDDSVAMIKERAGQVVWPMYAPRPEVVA